MITGTFTITIKQEAHDVYTIEAEGPGNLRVAPHTLAEPASWLTEEHRTTLAALAAKEGQVTSSQLQALGRSLYGALFTPTIALAFGRAQGSGKGTDGVRLCLLIEPPELAALPWEAVHDDQGWLAVRPMAPLVRRLPREAGIEYPQRLGVRGALRILFVGAAPTNVRGDLNIEADAKDLQDRLADAIKEKRVELRVLLNASLSDIKEALAEADGQRRKAYHVLYFAGHGTPNAILLDGGDGDPVENDPRIKRTAGDAMEVSAETLAKEVADTDIRLVFLAACETGGQPEPVASAALASFAAELTRRWAIPAVVAMQYEIGNLAAHDLAGDFFNRIAGFEPVDIAFTKARAANISGSGTAPAMPTATETSPEVLTDGATQFSNISAFGETVTPGTSIDRDSIAPMMYLQADDGALFQKARNWALYGLAALFPVLILLTVMLWRVGLSNQEQQVLRQALTLASNAKDSTFPSDPLLGLRMALEAREMVPLNQRQSDDFRSIEASILDMTVSGRVAAVPSPKNVGSIGFVPGSSLLLIGRTTAPSQILDLRQGSIITLTAQHYQLHPLEHQAPLSYFILEYYGDTPSELRRLTDGSLIETLPANVLSVEFSPFDSVPFFIIRYFNSAELRRTDDGSFVRQITPVEKAVFSQEADFPIFVMQPDGPRPNPAEIRATGNATFIRLLSDSVRGVFYSRFATSPLMVVDYNGGYESYSQEIPDRAAEVWSTSSDATLLNTLSDDIEQVYFSPQPAASVFVVSYLEEVTRGNDEIRSLVDGSLVEKLSGGISKVTFSLDPTAGVFVLDYGILERLSEIRSVENGERLEGLPYHVYHADAATLGDDSVFVLSYFDRSDGKPLRGEVLSARDGSLIGTLAHSLFTAHFSSHPAATVGVIDYYDDTPDEIRLDPDTAIRLRNNLNRVYTSEGGSDPYFVLTYGGDGGEVVSAVNGSTLITLTGNINDVEFGEVAGASYFLMHYDDRVELWSAAPLPHKLTDFGPGFAEIVWSDVPGRAAVRYDNGIAYVIALDWLEAAAQADFAGEGLVRIACKPFREGLFDDGKLSATEFDGQPRKVCS